MIKQIKLHKRKSNLARDIPLVKTKYSHQFTRWYLTSILRHPRGQLRRRKRFTWSICKTERKLKFKPRWMNCIYYLCHLKFKSNSSRKAIRSAKVDKKAWTRIWQRARDPTTKEGWPRVRLSLATTTLTHSLAASQIHHLRTIKSLRDSRLGQLDSNMVRFHQMPPFWTMVAPQLITLKAPNLWRNYPWESWQTIKPVPVLLVATQLLSRVSTECAIRLWARSLDQMPSTRRTRPNQIHWQAAIICTVSALLKFTASKVHLPRCHLMRRKIKFRCADLLIVRSLLRLVKTSKRFHHLCPKFPVSRAKDKERISQVPNFKAPRIISLKTKNMFKANNTLVKSVHQFSFLQLLRKTR